MFKDLFKKKEVVPTISNNEGRPQVFFYKEAAHVGEHGRIVVNSAKHGLNMADIPFAFAGVSVPPKLDLNMMRYIWDEALIQGYLPQELTGYGDRNNTQLYV